MEQRVSLLIEKILSKPSLSNPPPIEAGGIRYVSALNSQIYITNAHLRNKEIMVTNEMSINTRYPNSKFPLM